MCLAYNEKQKTTNDGRNRTTKSRKNLNALRKRNKYLGILGADTIKHAEMKEKFFKKNISGERENYSKPNYMAESHQRNKYLGCPPRKIHGTILKVNELQQMHQRTRKLIMMH